MAFDEQRGYTVYIHINKANGKKYVGITNEPLNRRWRNGNGYRYNNHFYVAIQKYGWDNFYHIAAVQNVTHQTACILEKLFITIYNSMNRQYGYNSTSGGEKNYVRTEDTKLYGKSNPMYGRSKELNPFYGKQHSQATISIMRAKKYGGNNPLAKPVMCINTSVVFPSCREASDWCHIPRQNIHRCCSGKRPTAGVHPVTNEKLKWRYVNSEI